MYWTPFVICLFIDGFLISTLYFLQFSVCLVLPLFLLWPPLPIVACMTVVRVDAEAGAEVHVFIDGVHSTFALPSVVFGDTSGALSF